ncbi:inactive beta-amylase 9 [Rhododendron vialii]|uniref:inactive beta-amylase 9 n=1 Tax=Rhododendron vialii TaxID=182163 RepID=UPI00265FFFB9|nr:inactive beta-amylase 9 [Rhododendron vialii]
MEISLIGNSQAKLVIAGCLVQRELGFRGKLNHQIFSLNSTICFGQTTRWGKRPPIRLELKAAANSEALASDKVCGSTSASRSGSKPIDGVRLYVGLPLDAVSDCNTINHARAITAGLKALKLLGVDGVELPVWWGIAEKEAMGKYEWSGYLKLAEMVQKAGLKLHISLCFHASKEPKIPLPDWVSRIGESQPSIFFTDRSGEQYRDCLSLSVDDLPVLDGKSPIQAYGNFCESFKSSFSAFLGSTITGISIGLGPDGELRYPSRHQSSKNNQVHGVGEFQCYDENMLTNLKQHAEAIGNPLWGLSGPHDSPTYDELPNYNNFVKENGGSWETTYGDFFLSWYSNNLTSHLDRLLSLTSSTFSDYPVKISGKVPLMHWWYKTRSHPSELTAGFYNTVNRDGYDEVVEIFAKNSCKVILPGMDLSDERQPDRALSSPESLLRQIVTACKKHGVEVSGQNSSISGGPNAFDQIKRNLLDDNEVVDLFTYQRMGAAFFSPDHFPKFTEFVRNLNQLELGLDDLPSEEREDGESIYSGQGKDLLVQTA